MAQRQPIPTEAILLSDAVEKVHQWQSDATPYEGVLESIQFEHAAHVPHATFTAEFVDEWLIVVVAVAQVGTWSYTVVSVGPREELATIQASTALAMNRVQQSANRD